jgi:hypothetical protein
VPVQRHGRAGLQQLAVQRRQDAYDIVAARRALYDARVLVYRFHKLPDDERHRLDALDLLLRADKLAFERPLLVLDVLLLQVDVLELPLQLLERRVLIVALCREALKRVDVRY